MRDDLVTAVLDVTLRQQGAVTAHQLRRLGVSAKSQRAAMAQGWLTPAAPGVVVLAASPDTWFRRLRVGLLTLDARGWVSHEAAAALYRLDGAPEEPVVFTVPRAARGLRARGLVHTTGEVRPGDVATVRGFRCSSPARTIIDLAHDGASLERLQEAMASAERRQLTTRREVAARLAELRGPGRWGATHLDRVLGSAAGRSGYRWSPGSPTPGSLTAGSPTPGSPTKSSSRSIAPTSSGRRSA
jgi:hypothetical protein